MKRAEVREFFNMVDNELHNMTTPAGTPLYEHWDCTAAQESLDCCLDKGHRVRDAMELYLYRLVED